MAEKPAKRRRGDRRDGVWLRDLDPMHAFTPYIYPNRADNEAFIQEEVDLTSLNAYIDAKNAAGPEFKYTYFQGILAALIKTATLKPRLNRFVAGNRVYQRNELTAAFVVKKRFSEEGDESLAYLRFEPDNTLEATREKMYAEINAFRKADKTDNSTDGMAMLLRMPRPILRLVMKILFALDYRGKVPYSLVKTDPNYSSVFLSNLGSIKLNAAYHHLNNWGTNSLFVVIGEKFQAPVYDETGFKGMREMLRLGITLDERIADGYYYSRAIHLLKHLLQNPELLERPANEPIEGF